MGGSKGHKERMVAKSEEFGIVDGSCVIFASELFCTVHKQWYSFHQCFLLWP